MKQVIVIVLLLCGALNGQAVKAQTIEAQKAKRQVSQASARVYVPGKVWQRRTPEQVGMDAAKLREAVEFARTRESRVPVDFSTQEETFGRLLGEMPKARGATNGLVIKNGFIVAEWGDTKKVDPTYSVAKSFLSTLLGVAIDKGLIKSENDLVADYITDGGYADAHNRKITWRMHAEQSSEWRGAMWGKSHDFVGVAEFGRGAREPRELNSPGEFYEYNDVRINRFALSLLRVFNQPLPQVLKREVMDKIDASETWRYVGYRNSDVMINGKPVKSVSGGTRWGGGLWISTEDEARLGLLFLRQGNWNGKQIVSRDWIKRATAPSRTKADYGYLWWLNTDKKQWANAPASSYAALGYGSNAIWINQEHDLVIVWRWYDGNLDDLIKHVLAAIKMDKSI